MSTFKPSSEQEHALELFKRGDTMVLEACAGSGKTTTLRMLTESTRERCLYLAFNKAVAADARASFPQNVECRTAHSLAARELRAAPSDATKAVFDRLNARRMSNTDVARWLGVARAMRVGEDLLLQPNTLAGMARTTVKRWCFSSAPLIDESHVPDVPGVTDPAYRGELTRSLIDWATLIWNDATSVDGQLRTEHDYYLKLYALTERALPCDVVCLDEAQDANPLLVQLISRQLEATGRGVIIGDSAQAIYGWRGAVDAMGSFPAQHRARLSASFRFGQPVADEANRFLSLLGSDMRVIGRGGPSTVGRSILPEAVLCRTNATAMAEVMQLMHAGYKVAIVGGGKDTRMMAEAAAELQTKGRTWHPELCAFTSWASVQEYVEHDGGADLRTFVNLIDSYSARTVIAAIEAAVPEELADVVVSTAHQSKGREWDEVRVAEDFAQPDGTAAHDPAELMLAYVTVTRARKKLDMGSLSWVQSTTPIPVLGTSPEPTTTSVPPTTTSVPHGDSAQPTSPVTASEVTPPLSDEEEAPAVTEPWPDTLLDAPADIARVVKVRLREETWNHVEAWAKNSGRDVGELIAEAMDLLASSMEKAQR